jgi:hypothetical protein
MVIRFSFILLIVTSLSLTAYFGASAWRLSNDRQLKSVGRRLLFEFVGSRGPSYAVSATQ